MIAGPSPNLGSRTVVVLRALGLGDLCTAVPALRALRRQLPGHRLLLAAPAWQQPLARLGGVDAVVDTAPLEPLDRTLHGADLAVNLHGRGPQSTASLLATRPRHLVAFAHHDLELPSPAVEWRAGEHEVHRWCRLLDESGIPADPSALRLPRPRPEHIPWGPWSHDPRMLRGAQRGSGRVAVVHPGAASAARRWPAQRFGAVVAALVGDGYHVVLTGTADERGLCEQVVFSAGARAAERATVLAGRTDVIALAATVAHAALVVANDTGVAHLATAFATPSVVLFGPTPPAEWGPPPSGPHRALWAGHRGDPHGTELDEGLAQITAELVIEEIAEVTRARVPA